MSKTTARTALHGALFATFLGVLLMAGPAQAQIMFTNKIIGADGRSQCLAVTNGQIANSSPLIIWDCVPNAPSQTFFLPGDGTMRIGAINSQYCVAAYDGVKQGTRIGVWQCVPSSPTQQLSMGMTPDLHFIGSGNPGICLGVQNASRSSGSPVIGWGCTNNGNDNETWTGSRAGAAPAPPPPPPPPPAPTQASITVASFHLITRMGSRCLGVQNSAGRIMAAGTQLIQWNCLDQLDQQFQFMANGQIRAFGGQGNMCVDAQGGLYHSGDHLVVFPCAQSTSKWIFSGGQIRPNTQNGMCVDLWGGWGGSLVSPNQIAQLAACNNQDNQSWIAGIIVPAGNSVNSIPPNYQTTITGHYPATVISHNGSALVASGGGNLVASGGGNLVASGGGNLVASGGGNLVASGGGNVIVPLVNGIVAGN